MSGETALERAARLAAGQPAASVREVLAADDARRRKPSLLDRLRLRGRPDARRRAAWAIEDARREREELERAAANLGPEDDPVVAARLGLALGRARQREADAAAMAFGHEAHRARDRAARAAKNPSGRLLRNIMELHGRELDADALERHWLAAGGARHREAQTLARMWRRAGGRILKPRKR